MYSVSCYSFSKFNLINHDNYPTNEKDEINYYQYLQSEGFIDPLGKVIKFCDFNIPLFTIKDIPKKFLEFLGKQQTIIINKQSYKFNAALALKNLFTFIDKHPDAPHFHVIGSFANTILMQSIYRSILEEAFQIKLNLKDDLELVYSDIDFHSTDFSLNMNTTSSMQAKLNEFYALMNLAIVSQIEDRDECTIENLNRQIMVGYQKSSYVNNCYAILDCQLDFSSEITSKVRELTSLNAIKIECKDFFKNLVFDEKGQINLSLCPFHLLKIVIEDKRKILDCILGHLTKQFYIVTDELNNNGKKRIFNYLSKGFSHPESLEQIADNYLSLIVQSNFFLEETIFFNALVTSNIKELDPNLLHRVRINQNSFVAFFFQLLANKERNLTTVYQLFSFCAKIFGYQPHLHNNKLFYKIYDTNRYCFFLPQFSSVNINNLETFNLTMKELKKLIDYFWNDQFVFDEIFCKEITDYISQTEKFSKLSKPNKILIYWYILKNYQPIQSFTHFVLKHIEILNEINKYFGIDRLQKMINDNFKHFFLFNLFQEFIADNTYSNLLEILPKYNKFIPDDIKQIFSHYFSIASLATQISHISKYLQFCYQESSFSKNFFSVLNHIDFPKSLEILDQHISKTEIFNDDFICDWQQFLLLALKNSDPNNYYLSTLSKALLRHSKKNNIKLSPFLITLFIEKCYKNNEIIKELINYLIITTTTNDIILTFSFWKLLIDHSFQIVCLNKISSKKLFFIILDYLSKENNHNKIIELIQKTSGFLKHLAHFDFLKFDVILSNNETVSEFNFFKNRTFYNGKDLKSTYLLLLNLYVKNYPNVFNLGLSYLESNPQDKNFYLLHSKLFELYISEYNGIEKEIQVILFNRLIKHITQKELKNILSESLITFFLSSQIHELVVESNVDNILSIYFEIYHIYKNKKLFLETKIPGKLAYIFNFIMKNKVVLIQNFNLDLLSLFNTYLDQSQIKFCSHIILFMWHCNKFSHLRTDLVYIYLKQCEKFECLEFDDICLFSEAYKAILFDLNNLTLLENNIIILLNSAFKSDNNDQTIMFWYIRLLNGFYTKQTSLNINTLSEIFSKIEDYIEDDFKKKVFLASVLINLYNDISNYQMDYQYFVEKVCLHCIEQKDLSDIIVDLLAPHQSKVKKDFHYSLIINNLRQFQVVSVPLAKQLLFKNVNDLSITHFTTENIFRYYQFCLANANKIDLETLLIYDIQNQCHYFAATKFDLKVFEQNIRSVFSNKCFYEQISELLNKYFEFVVKYYLKFSDVSSSEQIIESFTKDIKQKNIDFITTKLNLFLLAFGFLANNETLFFELAFKHIELGRVNLNELFGKKVISYLENSNRFKTHQKHFELISEILEILRNDKTFLIRAISKIIKNDEFKYLLKSFFYFLQFLDKYKQLNRTETLCFQGLIESVFRQFTEQNIHFQLALKVRSILDNSSFVFEQTPLEKAYISIQISPFLKNEVFFLQTCQNIFYIDQQTINHEYDKFPDLKTRLDIANTLYQSLYLIEFDLEKLVTCVFNIFNFVIQNKNLQLPEFYFSFFPKYNDELTNEERSEIEKENVLTEVTYQLIKKFKAIYFENDIDDIIISFFNFFIKTNVSKNLYYILHVLVNLFIEITSTSLNCVSFNEHKLNKLLYLYFFNLSIEADFQNYHLIFSKITLNRLYSKWPSIRLVTNSTLKFYYPWDFYINEEINQVTNNDIQYLTGTIEPLLEGTDPFVFLRITDLVNKILEKKISNEQFVVNFYPTYCKQLQALKNDLSQANILNCLTFISRLWLSVLYSNSEPQLFKYFKDHLEILYSYRKHFSNLENHCRYLIQTIFLNNANPQELIPIIYNRLLEGIEKESKKQFKNDILTLSKKFKKKQFNLNE